MAIIISSHKNCAIRSEEIVAVAHLKNKETNRFTNKVGIIFKSGAKLEIDCNTIKDATGFNEFIMDIMEKDY